MVRKKVRTQFLLFSKTQTNKTKTNEQTNKQSNQQTNEQSNKQT